MHEIGHKSQVIAKHQHNEMRMVTFILMNKHNFNIIHIYYYSFFFERRITLQGIHKRMHIIIIIIYTKISPITVKLT